jgi:hypothetical protein
MRHLLVTTLVSMPTPKRAKSTGLTMKAVAELPTAKRGRESMYAEAVRRLAAKPGQPFEIRSYTTPSAAQSGRQALVREAKKAGVALEAVASGSTLYAVASLAPSRKTTRKR